MDPRHRKYIIIASILLHLLFLVLWEGAIKLKLIDVEIPQRTPVEDKPIVFELQEPEPPRQVIETPEDAKTVEKQKNARFLSDKNALARNPETDPNLAEGEPFARGQLETHELPKNQGPRGETLKPVTPTEQETGKDQPKADPETRAPDPGPDAEAISRPKDLYDRQLERQQQIMKPGVQEQLPTVEHDNQESRALDTGGLSFNTYNWNFAPYMLELKRRIQRNIHPPAAFMYLGMISGETLVRFKIYPNGQMQDFQVLDSRGHKSLMVTSVNAVEVSAPFPVLPSDFPEPYLEVTGKFIYFVGRNEEASRK